MPRATDPQIAQRLNHAIESLRQGLSASEAAQRLVTAWGVSERQAFRYVEQAQKLKYPVPVGDAKVSFTVKLSQTLVNKLHQYAQSTGQTLSEIVSHALWGVLRRGGGRG
jgi:hypothetical protein